MDSGRGWGVGPFRVWMEIDQLCFRSERVLDGPQADARPFDVTDRRAGAAILACSCGSDRRLTALAVERCKHFNFPSLFYKQNLPSDVRVWQISPHEVIMVKPAFTICVTGFLLPQSTGLNSILKTSDA